MDVLEHSLDSGSNERNDDHLNQSDDEQQQTGHLVGTSDGTLSIDPTVQYQLRAEGGGQGQPVTYRVVQVSEAGSDAEGIMATAVLQPGAQAVIQNPFGASASSPHGDGMEARFAYVPSGGGDGDASGATTVLTTNQGAQVGQFYVMMSPQDVLQGQRSIAPRTAQYVTGKGDNQRTVRDDRRRSTHNEGNKAAHKEVERRRRDKINNWIVNLSKLIPECVQDNAKQVHGGAAASPSSAQSKGGILAKACEYINDLRTANVRMLDSLKDAERVAMDNDILRQQMEDVKQENALLRAQLQQSTLLQDHNGT